MYSLSLIIFFVNKQLFLFCLQFPQFCIPKKNRQQEGDHDRNEGIQENTVVFRFESIPFNFDRTGVHSLLHFNDSVMSKECLFLSFLALSFLFFYFLIFFRNGTEDYQHSEKSQRTTCAAYLGKWRSGPTEVTSDNVISDFFLNFELIFEGLTNHANWID